MASLLVVSGPPGAGKSTLAALLAEAFEKSVLVSGDAFFGFVAKGAIPPWLPGSDRQNEVVTEAAGAAAGRYVLGGFTTIYDGVVGSWFLPTFLRATGLAELEYVVLLPSVERASDASVPGESRGSPTKVRHARCIARSPMPTSLRVTC